MRSPRRWLISGPIILLLLSGSISSTFVGAESAEAIGFLGMLVGQLTAGTLLLRRSRGLEPSERRAWRYLAGTLLVAAVGVFAVGVWALTLGDPPAFGPIDAFFLISYVLLLAAVARLARIDAGGSAWVTTILDALVGAIALGALVWTAFLHRLVDDFMGAAGWEIAVGLAYPILDVAIVVGLMILIIRRSHYHFDVRLALLAAGMSVQVLSDFIYFSRGVGRSFAEAQPSWPLLLLATAFLLTAASVVDVVPPRREFPERGARIWALTWPYLLAAALLATHVVRYRSAVLDSEDVILLDALIVIGVVIFLRQVYEINRNRKRVEAQRSELVASVSHELRTPLTAIVGYLTLMNDAGDEFPEDARREMVAEATGEAVHMSRLVNDLVMLARGNNSRLPLQVTEVTVSRIVTSALRNVESVGASIEEELARDYRARLDADRIQQALTNLLTNAVRYGGDHVIVVTRAERTDLVLEVHDNGDGVPTRFESLIWQRFERGAHRLNAMAPGLGIGLAIVRAVAESHGGSAHYRDSERLGGACFTIRIPGCLVGEAHLPRSLEVSR